MQKAARALYEAAKEAFEKVKVTVQRLVELSVEAVARVLAWIDEHKAHLFLMAAAAAGAVALSVALNLWGLVELEKLAYAASAPFVAGLVDAGGRAAERFRVVAERWRADENVKQKIEGIIKEIINTPLKGGRPYEVLRKLAESGNLPEPLVKLKEALEYQDEVVQDAAVVAALVLYKTLVNNAEAYRKWAGWCRWARGLVEKQEFTVTAGKIRELREAHRRLEEVAEEVRRELNAVLRLYSRSGFYKERPDLLNKLKQLLEVDLGEAEELAEARSKELSKYSDANMGTKVYAALLSIARGGMYGHAAMLLMGEGALADVVLPSPRSAYNKADRVAERRGETVDPSRSRRGAKAGKVAGGRGGAVDLSRGGVAGWEDRAASVLLRYLLSKAISEDLVFRRVEGGFEVFRIYGGVEVLIDALKIEEAARSKAGEEVLRRFVEEAKKTAPDLSGFDKAPQYVEWRATDVTTSEGQIAAATAHPWQLRWYFGLLGEEKSFRGRANVTKEGVKLIVTAYWPREREDEILRESRWLEQLLGQRVESWRELVDAIDWSWVLMRVERLADKLKPWIGPEGMGDVEREGLVRRMLGELALLVHFAKARRKMDDGKWREERARRLAKAVEALSGGRIAGKYAERLAGLIISYAEKREKRTKERIENLAREVGVPDKEVWEIVEFVLGDMYCLARDCARDEVVRKFVAPALELIMLDKALNDSNESKREEALLIFGEMYATAVAGDGTVERRIVELTVGGELGGGAALLRLATLHLLNKLLPKELKFNIQAYMGEGRYYRIDAYGENAVRFMRLLAVTAASADGEYLGEKFNEFVKEAQVEVQLGNIRLTKSGVAANLTLSEGGVTVKYNVYLSDDEIRLEFKSTDRSRAELAARLLRLVGVTAEVKKVGDRDVWRIVATTDKLAAGREELRKVLAEFVRAAVKNEKKAEHWLEKLEKGLTLREGWPKYYVALARGGALDVRFGSTDPDSIKQAAQQLREMGLEEGVHFSVKMPEGGKAGYVYIRREGLAHAAWLSEYGSGEQQRLAAKFVKYILERAEKAGDDVHEEAKKIIDEGMSRGSQTLRDLEKWVEVNGKTYVVKVIDGEAVEEDRNGRKLLRIKITAEVDGVRREYEITYGRYEKNTARGYAYASANAPGGREADAERLAAVIETLTGVKPKIRRRSDGTIEIVCGREHLEGFMRYKELADAIMKWLKETSQ